MNKISKTQEAFFFALSDIQESVVLENLKRLKTSGSIESVFYDITLETICGVMSLLDGYETDSVQLDIIDKRSGESLRKGIELHDKCVDYLKCT